MHRHRRFDHQAQQQWATIPPELYVIRSPTGIVPKSSRRPPSDGYPWHALACTLKQSFSGAEQRWQAALHFAITVALKSAGHSQLAQLPDSPTRISVRLAQVSQPSGGVPSSQLSNEPLAQVLGNSHAAPPAVDGPDGAGSDGADGPGADDGGDA